MANELILVTSVLVAFGLPLLYLMFVRRIEKFGREPRRWLVAAFAVGGLIPAVFGFTVVGDVFPGSREFRVLLFAPVAEEILKCLAIGVFRKRITEPLDGIVYGAAVGLGFAAVEATLYAFQQWQGNNVDGAILTALGRVVTTALMHAITAALVGYGWTLAWSDSKAYLRFLGLLVVAMVVHTLYNLGAITFGGPRQAVVFYAFVLVLGAVSLPFLTRWARRSDRTEVKSI
jgi:protease PrsW